MPELNPRQWLLLTINTLLYRLILLLVSFLPRGLAFRIARRVGRLRYHRRRAGAKPYETNMQLALGASPGQAEDWMVRSFELAASEDLELWLYPRMTKERISELIELRGLENLESALARGKGAILHSGHVRGKYTFYAALGLRGFTPNVMGLRPSRNACAHSIDFHLYERREACLEQKLGCRFLRIEPENLGVAVRAASALRRNEVVTIAIDQTYAKQNVEVCFLRGHVPFPCGPVLLAQVTGAPLLSFFIHRTDQWIPQVADIGPPFYVTDDLAGAVQHCASELEKKIHLYPAGWQTWLSPKWHLWRNLG